MLKFSKHKNCKMSEDEKPKEIEKKIDNKNLQKVIKYFCAIFFTSQSVSACQGPLQSNGGGVGLRGG